jgi:hypothetical protein
MYASYFEPSAYRAMAQEFLELTAANGCYYYAEYPTSLEGWDRSVANLVNGWLSAVL